MSIRITSGANFREAMNPLIEQTVLGPLGQWGRTVAAAEPTVVDFGEQVLRHLEIVDSRAHVITAIELLSPSNKADSDAVLNWRRKRNDYLRVSDRLHQAAQSCAA